MTFRCVEAISKPVDAGLMRLSWNEVRAREAQKTEA